MDTEKVLILMAEFLLQTQEAQCLLCDNQMKNKRIKSNGVSQGCDGNCYWNKKYTKEDLIKLFVMELTTGNSHCVKCGMVLKVKQYLDNRFNDCWSGEDDCFCEQCYYEELEKQREFHEETQGRW